MLLPKYVDIFIITKNKDIARLVKIKLQLENSHTVIDSIDKYRGIGPLLTTYKDILLTYEYFGFIYDEKASSNERFQTVKYSLCDLMWENTIKNDIYVGHIIETFERELHLGILTPPSPYMSTFFKTGFCGWESYYEETIQFIKQLKLKCQINRDKPPFILETSFWCRTEALKPLFTREISQEDLVLEEGILNNRVSHVIERILPYVAQSQGYYSGIMMTAEYASLYISNYQYMWDELKNRGILK